jgi:hypothetical protein
MTHTTKVYFSNGGDTLTIQPAGTVTLTGNVSAVGSVTAGTALIATTSLAVGTTSLLGGIVTFSGDGTLPAMVINGAGSTKGTTAGTAYTSGPPAFASAQLSLRLNIGGTLYRIPVWADS